MADHPSSDPLFEWNRLNKENAENAIASLMLRNLVSATHVFESYCTWLLAGTGATAALFVANVESVLPYLSAAGFKWCGLLLVTSGVCGIVSKYLSLQCQFSDLSNARLQPALQSIFDRFNVDSDKIEAQASARGVTLDTELDMGRVITKYARSFPRWVAWLLSRHLRKHAGNPQIGEVLPIKFFIWQGVFLFLQIVLFLFAIGVAVVFAQAV